LLPPDWAAIPWVCGLQSVTSRYLAAILRPVRGRIEGRVSAPMTIGWVSPFTGSLQGKSLIWGRFRSFRAICATNLLWFGNGLLSPKYQFPCSRDNRELNRDNWEAF